MGDEKKVDLKTLQAQVEALMAELAKAKGGKGDGRLVDAITEQVDTSEKRIEIRAGNVEGKTGKVPGVLGVNLTKFYQSGKGKTKKWIPAKGFFIPAAEVDAVYAALNKVRTEAKTQGYF